MRWVYFSDSEVEGLEPDFVAKLDRARGIAGAPFSITSGYRSCSENERAMGVENSAHCKGLAVDLHCDRSQDRYKIVAALIEVGFNRLGVYDHHVHVDMDPEKPSFVMWTGISH